MASIAEKNAVFDVIRAMADDLIELKGGWFKGTLRRHLYSDEGTQVLLAGVDKGLRAAEEVRKQEAKNAGGA